MSSGGYKIRDQQAVHFITFTVVGWIDVFTRGRYRDILIESLKYCQSSKGMKLYAWCLMSNHVHLIVAADEGFSLSDILRDFKKYTSVKIIEDIKNNPSESRREWMLELFKMAGANNSRNEKYQFWQQNNHPIELSGNSMMDQKLDYIHNNAVETGWVDKAEDWVYSSARNYGGERGLIDVILL